MKKYTAKESYLILPLKFRAMDKPLGDMYACWRYWFAQPLGEKLKCLRQPGKGGYYPAASEAPGFTGEPDPKEYFHWRLPEAQGSPIHPDSSNVVATATERVFLDCWNKAQQWLEDHGLTELCTLSAANHVLRIIHYPPHPTGRVGAAHRDFDLLTVSVEGTAPGLEVFKPRECWHAGSNHGACDGWFPQETGVQVGEMLEIYTVARDPTYNFCESFSATTHRVRTAQNTDRLKAVFFYLPPTDFELRPGFTAGEYLKDALSKAGTYGIGAK